MKSRPPALFVLAGLLSFATVSGATAPTPSQIANLNTQIATPSELVTTVRLQTRSVFLLRVSSGGGLVGDQIWGTDGTETGTIRLLEPCDEICFDTFQMVAASSESAFFLGVESIARTPQLFVTDGTPAGTLQLTRLPPDGRLLLGGRAVLHVHWSERLQRLFFMAADSETGFELWSTDGTPESTGLLVDIFEGPDSSVPYFEFGAETDAGVIFTAVDEHGDEPWRTDGTPQGTVRLRDITPSAGFAPPTLLTQAGERVVFIADDGVHGVELWSTDGTPQGTFFLLDATPGSTSTGFGSRWSVDGQAFFSLVDLENPHERRLLRTDGTPTGTRILGDFVGVPGGLPALHLVGALGTDAVFTASGQLWTTDGTTAGTRAIDCAGTACPQEPHLFRSSGDRLVFRATDAARGLELWETDGTPEGTHPFADLCPGPCSSDPLFLGRSGENLFVTADDGSHGEELWSFGASNPKKLTDFTNRRPFPVGALDGGLTGPVEGRLGFLASDLEHGFAVWTSDGSPEGTQPVRTLKEILDAGSNPHAFTLLGAHVLFAAETDGQGLGLWRFGLQGNVLTRIATLDPDHLGGSVPRIQAVTTTGSKMFFADGRQSDGDIWVTDGTTGNTRNLGPGLAFGPDPSNKHLPALGSAVFFHGTGERSGLWITDGTVQGTRRVRETILGGEEPAVTFGGRVWFRALLETECLCEVELWSSDGTAEGTRPFANLAGADSSDPRLLTPFRGELYFVTSQGLFKTNGVAPPSEALPNFPLARIDEMAVLGNRLLLSIDAGGSEASLWATDGTVGGTAQIAPVSLRQGFHVNHPQRAELGGVLFFLDGQGLIWRTNGTPGGTFPVDLFPASVQEIVGVHALPSRLLLVVRDELGSEQAWLSSGTTADAELLPRIQTVGRDVLTFASRVFLSGDDGRTGLEPWTFLLPDSNPPPPPPPSGRPAAPERLRANGLGFDRVGLTWDDRSANESSFEIQAKGSRVDSVPETAATLPADTTSFVLSNLEPGRPYEFRVRARNAQGASDWSPVAVGTPVEITGDCAPGRVLCLQDDRFEVRVHWRHEASQTAGEGVPSPFEFSNDSGTFWFFDPANVELVVKVLDARTVNGFQWAFYGALSDVEYWITLTDTQTETNVTYHNPPREICGLGDVRAFPRPETPGSNLSTGVFPADRAFRQTVPRVDAGSTGPCTPGPENLCLSQERYRVEVDWRDHRSGDEGRGFAIPGTADSGFFWFFDPANVELVVKVLDARTVNGHVWVFFGALTDVEYTVTVTDTHTGLAKTYHNEPGNICGQADVRAF